MQISDALYPGLNIDGRNGKKYFAGIFSNPTTASSLYVLALLRQDTDSWTQIAAINAGSDINSDEAATAFLQSAIPVLNSTLADEYVAAEVVPVVPTEPEVPSVPEVPVDPTVPTDPVTPPVDPVIPPVVDPVTPVVPVESWIERVARFLVSNTAVVDGFLVFSTVGASAPAPIGTDGAGTGSDAPVTPASPVVEEPAAPVTNDQAQETPEVQAPVVDVAPVVETPAESVVVTEPTVDAPVVQPVVTEPGIVADVPAAVVAGTTPVDVPVADVVVDAPVETVVAEPAVEAAVEPAVVASSGSTATDTDIVTSIDAPVVSTDVPVVDAPVVNDAPAVVEIVEDNSPVVADANNGSAIVFNPNDM